MDKVKDDIKEKGMSADEVYDRATWRCIHCTSTPHKSGNDLKEKKEIINSFNFTSTNFHSSVMSKISMNSHRHDMT